MKFSRSDSHEDTGYVACKYATGVCVGLVSGLKVSDCETFTTVLSSKAHHYRILKSFLTVSMSYAKFTLNCFVPTQRQKLLWKIK